MLGLRFVRGLSLSCGKRGPLFIAVRGPLFIAVRGPLTIAAPPVAGHRLQTRRLSSCGSRTQLLRSMWDLLRPGLEPVSPALAGRFSTTAPPGKPTQCLSNQGSHDTIPRWTSPDLATLLGDKAFRELFSAYRLPGLWSQPFLPVFLFPLWDCRAS